MFKYTHLALILGIGAAISGLPRLSAQQKDPNYNFDQDENAGVAAAIHFQRAEEAAAARQARIEAARAGDNSADRMAPAPKAHHVKTATARKVPPPPQH